MSDINIIVQEPESILISTTDEPVIISVSEEPVNISISEAPVNVTVTDQENPISVIEENVNIAAESTVINVTVNEGGNSADISHIEAELQMAGTVTRYKTLEYTGENVTVQRVYTDNTMTVQLYELTYNYLGDSIATIVIERISDNFSYTKTFTYDVSGNLISVNYI